MVEKFSTNPRTIIRRPIDICEGSNANLTFVDPEIQWKVEVSRFKSKSKNSPFDGRVLKGRAVGIFNHGQILLV
jgi:dihydroorotase